MGLAGRIASAALESPLTPLAGLVALLLGIFAVVTTPREEEPQIDVTVVDVLVPFPGAAVHDVESLVTVPAEQVLSQMAGIEHVYSVSRPGAAMDGDRLQNRASVMALAPRGAAAFASCIATAGCEAAGTRRQSCRETAGTRSLL